MSEAIIRRFRGFATNLPDLNNGAFAEDVLNVYEKTPGELVRREGCRRAIEYVADGPITMIRSIVEPGGEYTGSGMDLLLQAGPDIVGESSPRSTIVPSSPTTPSGGESVDYSPLIWKVLPYSVYGHIVASMYILGSNFDSEPGTPIVFSYSILSRPTAPTLTPSILYLSPQAVKLSWGPTLGNVYSNIYNGDLVSVTLTNPDGQSTTYQQTIVW